MLKNLIAKAGIKAAMNPIAEDMKRVDAMIHQTLGSDIRRVAEVADYITNSGGKRMRPALVLLCSRALGHEGDDAVFLGAVIEILHTATLMHDDVVDESDMRRGRPTANARWDNPTAVLVGDFLYTRAFQMMVSTKNLRAMAEIAAAANRLSEGEVLQMDNAHDPSVGKERYYEVIERKTACLFECAAQIACSIANPSEEKEKALTEYALRLGYAFQIADDVLDYAGDSAQTGKNLGADLEEGKVTLPLIYAMQRAKPEDRALIEEAVRRGHGDFVRISEIVRETGSLEASLETARHEAELGKKALGVIPESVYRSALELIIDYTVERNK
ncbi:MAG: polyprenyl synthetase family protein [Sutterellaceae bacterium]|nr:polyprenyl synthetase family protein [Sutterellaceae bacterium]MDD7441444.1 polyprenyl synthetase family protein [Sutterellaceae bacterium]MDY2868756.1 polyprenyl synthetase family protein [Mesosutterella sp.]